MKLQKFPLFALLLAIPQSVFAAIPTLEFSPLVLGAGSILYLDINDAYLIVDSTHCPSWLYTADSKTRLDPAATEFDWSPASVFPINFPKSLNYIDNSNVTYLSGRSEDNIKIAGIELDKPFTGGMITAELFANIEFKTSGGIGIGLGRAVAGRGCGSLIDAIGASAKKTFTLILKDASDGNTQLYNSGWYSAKLSDFDDDIFVEKPINIKLLPEVRNGATVTKMTGISVLSSKSGAMVAEEIPTVIKDDGTEDPSNIVAEEKVEFVVENDSEKIFLPWDLRSIFGSNLVFNFMDLQTLMPLCTLERVAKALVKDDQYEIVKSSTAGIYQVQLENGAELNGTLVFKLADGQDLPINPKLLFVSGFPLFVGYKLCELPCHQARVFSQYGCDAIFLGHGLLLDYALEHTVAPKASLVLRQFRASLFLMK